MISGSRYSNDVVFKYEISADIYESALPVRRRFRVKYQGGEIIPTVGEDVLLHQMAFYVYGISNYWWILMLANPLYYNPFDIPSGTKLSAPDLDRVEYVPW